MSNPADTVTTTERDAGLYEWRRFEPYDDRPTRQEIERDERDERWGWR